MHQMHELYTGFDSWGLASLTNDSGLCDYSYSTPLDTRVMTERTGDRHISACVKCHLIMQQ